MNKYPHWYCDDENMDCCTPDDDMVCCDIPGKVRPICDTTLKDRLQYLLGSDVLFSVDARICKRETFCGTLCYIGCDFIIVNVCLSRKPVSMHVPLKMIRFIAPFKGRRNAY